MLVCCLLTGVWLVTPTVGAQDGLPALAGNGSVLLRSPTGETLISLNPHRALIPASLVKIPLAQVALATLGEDFRFETHFYRNAAGDLLIRGLGDPLLVSEEIALIAQQLAAQGLLQVRRLVVDDSAFAPNLDLPRESTDDPYAARNSALAANFNTVNLAWTDHGELVSAESQTPLTPLARQLGARLDVAQAGRPAGEPYRINLGSNPLVGLQQLQQLFLHFFAASGIAVADPDFSRQAVSDQWTLCYRHRSSRSLQDNLQAMLVYSNNFIANQLLLTLGAQDGGYPATVEAARAVLQQQLAELYGEGFGRQPAWLIMLEGAGLSRRQLSSAAGMIRILEVFMPHADWLPEVDGVRYKTGTLTGVYNVAGYIPAADGLYPFAILTNQAANHRDAILQLLRQRVARAQSRQ